MLLPVYDTLVLLHTVIQNTIHRTGRDPEPKALLIKELLLAWAAWQDSGQETRGISPL